MTVEHCQVFQFTLIDLGEVWLAKRVFTAQLLKKLLIGPYQLDGVLCIRWWREEMSSNASNFLFKGFYKPLCTNSIFNVLNDGEKILRTSKLPQLPQKLSN